MMREMLCGLENDNSKCDSEDVNAARAFVNLLFLQTRKRHLEKVGKVAPTGKEEEKEAVRVLKVRKVSQSGQKLSQDNTEAPVEKCSSHDEKADQKGSKKGLISSSSSSSSSSSLTRNKKASRDSGEQKSVSSSIISSIRSGVLPNITLRLRIEDKPEVIDEADEHGYTPLHVACTLKSQVWVKTLLELGADPSLRTKTTTKTIGGVKVAELGGDMPIHLAVLSGCVESCKQLVAAGADVSTVNDALKSSLELYYLRPEKKNEQVEKILNEAYRKRLFPQGNSPVGWTEEGKPPWLPEGWLYVGRRRKDGELEKLFLSPNKREVLRTRLQVFRYIREADVDDCIVKNEEYQETALPRMSDRQKLLLKTFDQYSDPKGRLKKKMRVIVYDNILIGTGVITKTRVTRDGEEFRVSWDKDIKDDIPDRWKRAGLWWIRDQFRIKLFK